MLVCLIHNNTAQKEQKDKSTAKEHKSSHKRILAMTLRGLLGSALFFFSLYMLTYAGVEHWLIENCQLTCAACVRSVGKPEHPEETTHTLNCANHYIIMPPYLPFDLSRWTSSKSSGPSPGVVNLFLWKK